MYVIEAKKLVREYARGRGVCGVDFSVEPGECFAVLGRNGAGKSTLVRLLLGLERPDSGSLSVNGRLMDRGGDPDLKRIGIVPDASAHWEHLNGKANAFFVARCYGMRPGEIGSRLDALFRLADLSPYAEDPVRTYSFGMRRKLSMIEAICHKPELLVLDEPTMGVDTHFLLKLAEEARSRTREGKTTWVSSNDPDWIGTVATRVAFMASGQIITLGRVADLVDEIAPFQELRVTLAKDTSIPAPRRSAVRAFEQRGRTITALLHRDPALVPMVMEYIVATGGEISTLKVRQGTLRDAYLLKTGASLET